MFFDKGRSLPDDILMFDISKIKDKADEFMQHCTQPDIQRFKIAKMVNFLPLMVAQAKYLVDICAAINRGAGHQSKQFTHTGFKNLKVRAADIVKLQKQLIQQLLRAFFIPITN